MIHLNYNLGVFSKTTRKNRNESVGLKRLTTIIIVRCLLGWCDAVRHRAGAIIASRR